MNLLIKWQFTKENPACFKTQAEIVQSYLIPLVEDNFFQRQKVSFYITKVYLTNVRLAVFVNEKNINDIRHIVLKYTKELKVNPIDPDKPNENNGWDGSGERTGFTFLKNTSDCEEIFYTRFLEDITLVGIALHKKGLTVAVPIAVKARYETKPFSGLSPREKLEQYFCENCDKYRNKSVEDRDRFWSDCGFGYKSSGTAGDHFYYNITLGIDPLGMISQCSAEDLISCINKALKE